MSQLITLNEIVEINPRIPKRLKADLEQKVSFVPMASVSGTGSISSNEERSLRDVMKGYTYFQKGDVLLAKITPCFENGKAAVVNGLPRTTGFGSTEFHVLRPRKDVDAKYLFYQIWNPVFRFIGSKNMTGTAGQKRLPADFLKRHKIPLPLLAEQKRIAAILDKADAIRRKRQQAIKLADDFLRATFLDMFGDPVVNPKRWEVYPIRALGKVITGSTPSSQKDGMFGDEIPFVTPGDLESDSDVKRHVTEEGAKNSRTVREGATFVCCIGATIGKVDMARSFCAFYQQINAIDWGDSVVDVYGYWAMRFLKSVVIKKAITTTLPILKKSIFETIEMPLPPLDLQKKFETVFSKCLNNIHFKKIALEQSELLFNSLTQRAFRGEL